MQLRNSVLDVVLLFQKPHLHKHCGAKGRRVSFANMGANITEK